MNPSKILSLVLALSIRQAYAQLPAVISAPIEEGISRKQIVHQAITGVQMAEGKNLAGAMTKVSGQIKGVMDATQQLHDKWYSGLLKISSGVRNYRRVKEIYAHQSAMLDQYGSVLPELRKTRLTPTQLRDAGVLYQGLLLENIGLLTELISVLSAGQAKMTDPDRLDFINTIADRVSEQHDMMNYLTSKCRAIASQQDQAIQDQAAVKSLTGAK